MNNSRSGWFMVKLLMLITGILIFIYLVTPKLQKDIYKIRDLTTKRNLSYIRVAILNFKNNKGSWPLSLTELVPKYLDKIPPEHLSSLKGSIITLNAENDKKFLQLRTPGAKGWIYAAYDLNKGNKFAHKVLPASSTLSDKSGDTSSW